MAASESIQYFTWRCLCLAWTTLTTEPPVGRREGRGHRRASVPVEMVAECVAFVLRQGGARSFLHLVHEFAPDVHATGPATRGHHEYHSIGWGTFGMEPLEGGHVPTNLAELVSTQRRTRRNAAEHHPITHTRWAPTMLAFLGTHSTQMGGEFRRRKAVHPTVVFLDVPLHVWWRSQAQSSGGTTARSSSPSPCPPATSQMGARRSRHSSRPTCSASPTCSRSPPRMDPEWGGRRTSRH